MQPKAAASATGSPSMPSTTTCSLWSAGRLRPG